MTMLAALAIGTRYSTDLVMFVCDSRVTRQSKGSGKYEARTDKAQKLVHVAPNIVIGIAGEYSPIDSISKLQKRLIRQQTGRPYWAESPDIVVRKIASGIRILWWNQYLQRFVDIA